MAKDTIFERIRIFKEFQNSSESIFEEFKMEDNKYKKFDDYYILCICPKGRNGGISKRLFEVFYGNRIFDHEEKIRSDFSSEKKLLTEHGTTLSFCLNDHGYVAIILYPSGTDYTKSVESAIFVKNYVHPKKLKDKSFLKRQWTYLNSYMERTSIDGYPTLKEKLICSYLRYNKNLVIDNKFQSKKIISHLVNCLRFVLTVGLSGFLILLFNVLLSKTDNSISIKENVQLNQINTSLKELINIQKQEIKKDLERNINDSLKKSKTLSKSNIK